MAVGGLNNMTVVRPPHPKFREVLFTESRHIVNESSVLRLRNRDLQQPWSHQLPRYLSKLRSASMQKTPLRRTPEVPEFKTKLCVHRLGGDHSGAPSLLAMECGGLTQKRSMRDSHKPRGRSPNPSKPSGRTNLEANPTPLVGLRGFCQTYL